MNFFIFVSQEWFLIAILIALLTLLVALMRKNNGIPISSSQLVGLMNQDKAILLDVRSAKDFSLGHIHGSINIPHNTLESRANELEKHKESLIVITDQMGQHAGAAGGCSKQARLSTSEDLRAALLNGNMATYPW